MTLRHSRLALLLVLFWLIGEKANQVMKSEAERVQAAEVACATLAIGLIRALTDARPIKPTSTQWSISHSLANYGYAALLLSGAVGLGHVLV